MKKILCVIVLLLFSVTVQAMTPIEFQKIGTGDIVTLNLEWNGKVYLQGDSVVAFKQGDSAWVASINPLNNFSGSFHCGYLTLVKSNQEKWKPSRSHCAYGPALRRLHVRCFFQGAQYPAAGI